MVLAYRVPRFRRGNRFRGRAQARRMLRAVRAGRRFQRFPIFGRGGRVAFGRMRRARNSTMFVRGARRRVSGRRGIQFRSRNRSRGRGLLKAISMAQPVLSHIAQDSDTFDMAVGRKIFLMLGELAEAEALQLIQNRVPDIVSSDVVPNSRNTYANNQFMLRRAVQEIELCNASTAGVTVKAHLCVPRRDLAYSEQFNGDGTVTLVTNPVSWIRAGLWTRALGNAVEGGAPANSNPLPITQLNVTLFDSPAFVEAFKVVKTRQQFLLGGTIMRLKASVRAQVVKSARYLRATSAAGQQGALIANQALMNDALRGLTKFWIFEIVGQPVASTADPTAISTSNSKFNFVVKERYDYNFIVNNATFGTIEGAMDVVADPRIVDPMDDDVEAVVVA